TKRLDFYEQRARRWTRTQSLDLIGRCRESFQFLDLAGTVLVLGANDAICVYELRGDTWIATALLPIVSGPDDPRTNGDRIAQHAVRPDSIRLSRRPKGLWELERTIHPPARCRIESFAISSRWLAVTMLDTRDDSRHLQLYALGATVEPVAVLHPLT